ncbi:DUF724 domain-containing protein 6-like isoform X7 [Carya illinoinensis]|uniref:DUF724 domain-containing protein 6-like isoform X7 n=1 Tax=Carya illinoinensis TaxID=32201 RepID=UPI001C71C761|nr:DUF724 domain-containing protein 6-like isoform X7 [Carya illinoinensis]
MGSFESSSETKHLYSLGAEVEVTSAEPGFKGSWYLATIIDLPSVPSPKMPQMARVEYQTLLTEDGSEPLKEYVDLAFIRPSPPQQEVAAQNFEHGDVVSAYFKEGWWTGVVVRVLGDSSYRVFFENPPDVIEFGRKDLRVHLEWLGEKWVRIEKQMRQDQFASNPEGTVEAEGLGVTRDSMSERTLLSANSVKKSMEQSSLGDGKELSYALTGNMKKMKLPTPDGNSTESHPSKKLRRRNTLEALLSSTVCDLKKRQSKTSTKVLSGLATPNSEDKQSRHSGAAKVWTGQQKHGQLDSQETNTMRSKEGRSTKSQVKSPLSSAADAGKEDNGDAGTAEEIVHEDKICPHISGGNSIKRKRGRPRKVVVTISKGKEQNGAGGAADGTVVEVLPTQGVASYMLTEGKSTGTTDSHDVSTANNVGMTSLAASGNMDDDDDQPLSTWIDGMLQCPTIIKESKLSPVRTVNECSEVREQNIDIAQQVRAADATSDCVLDDNRSLPFVKSSPIWKTIEGMEIFRLMPQDPHFHPLGKCKEEYREGLAVANMVTFTSLVEKISKLRLDDSRSIFYGYLESLHEMEKHGFNVTVLQGRMNKLLSIKDREGQILNESKDAEFKILHYNQEKTLLAEEMTNITTQITKLQVEHTLIESKMKSKELEISRLQKRVDSINEDIQSAQLDFEKIAAAPWKLG